MLFHEVYSKYYYAIAQILTQTHNKPLSQKEIEDNIVKKNTFKETYLNNDFFKNDHDKNIWKKLTIKKINVDENRKKNEQYKSRMVYGMTTHHKCMKRVNW